MFPVSREGDVTFYAINKIIFVTIDDYTTLTIPHTAYLLSSGSVLSRANIYYQPPQPW